MNNLKVFEIKLPDIYLVEKKQKKKRRKIKKKK